MITAKKCILTLCSLIVFIKGDNKAKKTKLTRQNFLQWISNPSVNAQHIVKLQKLFCTLYSIWSRGCQLCFKFFIKIISDWMISYQQLWKQLKERWWL